MQDLNQNSNNQTPQMPQNVGVPPVPPPAYSVGQIPVQQQANQHLVQPGIVNPQPIPQPITESPVPSSLGNFQPVSSVPTTPNIAPVQNIPPSGGSKFPLKKILIAAAAIILISVMGFVAWKMFYKPAPKEIDLTYWDFREDSPALESLISQYEQQNPLVKIKYVAQSKPDYRERLTSSIAKGEAPDIFPFHNTWLVMLPGQLSPLPPEVMDKNTYASTFYPTAVNDLSQSGNIYGMPVSFDGLALYINQSIFDAAGKTPPTTWDELRQAAHDLTVVDENRNIQQAGVAMGRTDNVDHWQDILSLLILQVGIDPTHPNGKLAEDTLNYFTIFAGNDRSWDETLPPSTQAFANGKVAMYLGPASEIETIRKLNPNLSFKVVKAPQLAHDVPTAPNINWASYWADGVWMKSKNATEAWKFINFLSQKESLQALNKEQQQAGSIGFIYPRTDMAEGFDTDPYVGAYYSEAPTAKSWYMASNTYDGSNGINTKVSTVYAQAIDAIQKRESNMDEIMNALATNVSQVFATYQGK